MRAGEIEAKGFTDGGGEAVTIGVVAAPAGGREQESVDGADRTRGGVDGGDAIKGYDLVRVGEVEPVKFFSRKSSSARGRSSG